MRLRITIDLKLMDDTMILDNARRQWAEGEERLHFLEQSRPKTAKHVLRVIDEILAELAKRVGQVFTTEQLVETYAGASEWCREIAHATAPDEPYAWELGIVQDAAFASYARQARDYMT